MLARVKVKGKFLQPKKKSTNRSPYWTLLKQQLKFPSGNHNLCSNFDRNVCGSQAPLLRSSGQGCTAHSTEEVSKYSSTLLTLWGEVGALIPCERKAGWWVTQKGYSHSGQCLAMYHWHTQHTSLPGTRWQTELAQLHASHCWWEQTAHPAQPCGAGPDPADGSQNPCCPAVGSVGPVGRKDPCPHPAILFRALGTKIWVRRVPLLLHERW